MHRPLHSHLFLQPANILLQDWIVPQGWPHHTIQQTPATTTHLFPQPANGTTGLATPHHTADTPATTTRIFFFGQPLVPQGWPHTIQQTPATTTHTFFFSQPLVQQGWLHTIQQIPATTSTTHTFFFSQLTAHCHLEGVTSRLSLARPLRLLSPTRNLMHWYDRRLSDTWFSRITAATTARTRSRRVNYGGKEYIHAGHAVVSGLTFYSWKRTPSEPQRNTQWTTKVTPWCFIKSQHWIYWSEKVSSFFIYIYFHFIFDVWGE